MTYGDWTRDVRTTEPQTTVAAVDELFLRCHPKSLTRVRPTARYVTASRSEIVIEQHGPKWTARFWHGGVVPMRCSGTFTSFRECEQAVIQYLRATDKFGKKAIWPGKE